MAIERQYHVTEKVPELASIGHEVPEPRRVGVRANVNVPTSRSPDGDPLVGPVEGLPTMFVAANFFGGLSVASVCRYLAQRILGGEPSIDLWPFDSRRYGDYATRSYARARALAAVGAALEIDLADGRRGARIIAVAGA